MKLTSLERRQVEALLESFFPGRVTTLPGAIEIDLVPQVETLLAQLPWGRAMGLRLLLAGAAFSLPLVVGGRLRSLAALQPSEREEILAAASDHSTYLLRQMAFLLKGVACLCYFQEERVRETLSLPPVVDPLPASPDPLAPREMSRA